MDLLELQKRISIGVPFSINLKERSLVVDNKKLIDNGNQSIDFGECMQEQITAEKLEDLFLEYAHSGHEKRIPRNYMFNKIKDSDLTESDLICCNNSHMARFELEFAMLRGLMNGSLQWCIDEMSEHNHYFWKSKRFPQFIIYKNYLV